MSRQVRILPGHPLETGRLFRGEVNEDGQYVACRVPVNPPADITWLATRVGPLDAELLSTGGIMRCLIDRHNIVTELRVFPYAAPDAQLPSARH